MSCDTALNSFCARYGFPKIGLLMKTINFFSLAPLLVPFRNCSTHTLFYFCLFFLSFLYRQGACCWEGTLSERASNPITNLTQLQFENDFTPKNDGTKDCSNTVLIKPLLALKERHGIPFEQLIRIKCQVPTLPHSSVTKRGTSLGDTQFFDLFITEEPSWGRWGVGPMAIFPTAATSDAGQRKWQIGPAFGMSILAYPHFQFGFLAQNPISFAGNRKASNQNTLLFQPFAIYHFFKNSYLVSNAEWTVDWRHHAAQIPINLGIGHTFPQMGGFELDGSLQFQWMAYQNAVSIDGYVPQYTIQLCVNILFK